jgi:hypothetical protein
VDDLYVNPILIGYNTHTPDNVCTHIQGRHVTEFCIQVEDCLDTRGHELDHFKEQIKSKL